MDEKIGITITGGYKSGKSTLAAFIGKALNELGIDVEVFDTDTPAIMRNRVFRMFKGGISTMKSYKVKVVIKTEQIRKGAKIKYPPTISRDFSRYDNTFFDKNKGLEDYDQYVHDPG